VVLDLGAAPGGWSQVAIKMVGRKGQVIASDILNIKPIDGVDFLRGDFTARTSFKEIINWAKIGFCQSPLFYTKTSIISLSFIHIY
jgi:23S rRNA (uridine2552-2'-O)-methyltransferase